ncbi:hypothetical protein [Dokdonella soli]|uniref:Uncharacterized protein n=1 Tax=Dokdonella soli TaxID=529810 RepID=A0ABN1IPT4_9GAMM
MTAHAVPQVGEQAGNAVSWPLRMAQRAFAALIDNATRDHAADIGTFRMARRTLSALSADDLASLSRWLTLQLVTGTARDAALAGQSMSRVDAMLAATIGAAIARTHEELLHGADAGAAAA